MTYINLEKTIENSLKKLSGKDFSSMKELSDALSQEWMQVMSKQSGNMSSFMKNSIYLLPGIEVRQVKDKQVFFLLRLLGLARKKTVFRFSYEKVNNSIHELLVNADVLEKIIQSLTNDNKDLQELSEDTKNIPDNMISESRFHRFASTYQRILMDVMDLPDQKWAAIIKKDVKSALNGQGMSVVEYDETNNHFFDVEEDEDCEKVTMISPAIIRKNDEKIITKGKVFVPEK